MFTGKLLVAVGILPLALLAVASAASGIRTMNDPCVLWEAHGVSMQPGGRCATVRGFSQSEDEFVTDLVLREAIILIVCVLALLGTFLHRPVLGYLAAAALFFVTVPLLPGTLWILTLFSALCVLAETIQTSRRHGVPASA